MKGVGMSEEPRMDTNRHKLEELKREFLIPVTKRYLQGKVDKKLYPIDAGESMLEYAISCQGGPRKCTQCNNRFTSSAAVYTVCPSCRDASQLKKFLDAREEKPGSVIMSLVTGDYGHSLEDFEELALDLCEPGQDLCNDAIVWHCRLVNPSPNRPRVLDWDAIAEDYQPIDADYVEPSEEVQAAIDAFNQALKKMEPISYGPHWETRLPIGEAFLKREGLV